MSGLARFGIIGDIHAEHEALEAALDHLSALSVDAVLAVGDIADGPGDVNACCRLLASRGVAVVRGNHERWLLRGEMRTLPDATPTDAVDAAGLAYLQALPTTLRFGTLLLCHGLGENDMAGVRPHDEGYALETNDELRALQTAPEVNMVVCGHTHRRMVRAFPGVTIINAGTLLRFHQPCFGLVELDALMVTFFERSAAGGVMTASRERLPLLPSPGPKKL